MNGRDDDDPGHEEVLALLPWYANRTLDPEDAASVSRHLERCEECRAELRLLASLNEAVRDDADERYRRDADTDTALASVLERIDAESDSTGAKAPWPARLTRAVGRMLPHPIATPSVRWSATVLAGLLVATLGLRMYHGGAGDDYSVLSSPDLAHGPIRLAVDIASTSDRTRTRSDIESALSGLALGADIDPASGGGYVVVLDGDVGVDELNALMRELGNAARIERVELLP